MPQLILKSTGKKKQYYVQNGFYSNRFTLQNQFEPDSYIHAPDYSEKNHFTIPKIPVYNDFPPTQPIEELNHDQLEEVDNIADRYINEAKAFALKQQIQMDQMKREIEVGKQFNEMVDPRINQKTENLLLEQKQIYNNQQIQKQENDEILNEIRQIKQEQIAQYSEINNGYQQQMGQFQRVQTNQQLNQSQQQAVQNQEQNDNRQMIINKQVQPAQNQLHKNPFYQPSQPAPQYVQDLSKQFLHGVLQLEEAYQKQTKTSEAAHFASIIQKEREISDYKEIASEKTVTGLLSRVSELEQQTVQIRKDEGIDMIAEQILKKYGLSLNDNMDKKQEVDKEVIISEIQKELKQQLDKQQPIQQQQVYCNQQQIQPPQPLQHQFQQQSQNYQQNQYQPFIQQQPFQQFNPYTQNPYTQNYQNYPMQNPIQPYNHQLQSQPQSNYQNQEQIQEHNRQQKEKNIENELLQLKIQQLQQLLEAKQQNNFSQSFEKDREESLSLASPVSSEAIEQKQKKRPASKQSSLKMQRAQLKKNMSDQNLVNAENVNPGNLLQVPDIPSVKLLSTMDNSRLNQSQMQEKSTKQAILTKSPSFTEQAELSKQQSFRNFVKHEITERVEEVKRRLSASTIEDDFDDKSIIDEGNKPQKTPVNPFAAVKQLINNKVQQIDQNMKQNQMDSLMIELDDENDLNQPIIKPPPLPKQQSPIVDVDDFELDIPL